MATKFGRMVTYFKGLLAINSYNALIMWFCKVTWQTTIIISPIPQCLWPSNLLGWWRTLSDSPIKLLDHLAPWSCFIMWQTKIVISPLPLPPVLMTTKFGRVVTYPEVFLLIKLLDFSMTCFCEFMPHDNYFISPFALDQ